MLGRSRHLHLVAASLFIAVIALCAWSIPALVVLVPLLIAAPALSVLFGSPTIVALAGVEALGAQAFLHIVLDRPQPLDYALQAGTLVTVTAVAVLYTVIWKRWLRELAQVRLVSEAAQRVLMRPLPRRIGQLRIASTYSAATAEANVGGDLYAALRATGGTRLIIGDVSGKGLATIGDAAMVVYAFRQAAHQHAELPGLAENLDDSVIRNMAELAEIDYNAREYFVTAAMLHIPDDKPVVELVNCGHPPPLLLRGREVTELQAMSSAPPLGMAALFGVGHQKDTFSFEPGDVLVLHTDGVTEARNAAGEFYPLAERIRNWFGLDPEDLVQQLRADLVTYVGGRLADDAALLVVKREYE